MSRERFKSDVINTFSRGQVTRLLTQGDDGTRTEISLQEVDVIVARHSDSKRQILGERRYGYVLVRVNDFIKTFIEIIQEKPGKDVFSFYSGSERIGYATGENFDLVLAQKLKAEGDPKLDDMALGSSLSEGTVDFIQSAMF